jgi:MFS family permease
VLLFSCAVVFLKGGGVEVPPGQRNRILALLFAGVLMGALDISIIGPAIPAIREAFGIDDRAAAWMLSIYVLFNLIGTPLMAKLSDRYGRRAVYTVDVAIFAAGSLMVAMAPSYGVILMGRAVQGLGAGGIFPVAAAVIGDIFPPERRGAALGLIGAVFGLAFLIGPIIGGVLLLFGWPWLFLVNLPIAAVVIVGAWRLLPTGPRREPRPFDVAGLATLTIGLVALSFGLNRLDAADIPASLLSPEVGPLLMVAVVLALTFVYLERRAIDPIIRPGLFRSRQVAIAGGLGLGAGITEAAVVFVPALFVASFGVTTSRAAFMLLPIVMALVVGAPVFGRMLDRVGSRLVILCATGLITTGMSLVAAFPDRLYLVYAAGFTIGLGMSGLMGSSLRYVMLHEAPPEDRGAAQGVLTVFISTGRLVGAAALGAVIGSLPQLRGFSAAYLIVAVLMALLFGLALALHSRDEERERARAQVRV